MIAIYSTDIQRRNYPTQLHAWTLIVTLQVNWFFLRQTREKPLQKKKKNSSFSIICRTELVDEKPNFVLVKTGLRQCQACPSVSSLPYSHQNGLWTGNFCKKLRDAFKVLKSIDRWLRECKRLISTSFQGKLSLDAAFRCGEIKYLSCDILRKLPKVIQKWASFRGLSAVIWMT